MTPVKRIAAAALSVALAVIIVGCEVSHTDTGKFTLPTEEPSLTETTVTQAPDGNKLDILRDIDVPPFSVDGFDASSLYAYLSLPYGSSQIGQSVLAPEGCAALYRAMSRFRSFTDEDEPDDKDEINSFLSTRLPLIFEARSNFVPTPIYISLRAWNAHFREIWGASVHTFDGGEFYRIGEADFSSDAENILIYLPEYSAVAVFTNKSHLSGDKDLYYILSASPLDGPMSGGLIVSAFYTHESTQAAAADGILDINSRTFDQRQSLIADLINRQTAAKEITPATAVIVKAVFVPSGGALIPERIVTQLGILRAGELDIPEITTEEDTTDYETEAQSLGYDEE